MNEQNFASESGTILIVDDTPTNLHLLSTMLAMEGYKARVANSGARALASIEASQPDLILLDIMMPEMDGYRVCAELKANENTRDIPIIFISALDAAEDKVKAFTAGGVDYITKPFYSEEVIARIRTHLQLRMLQKQLQQTNLELEERVAQRTAELVFLNQKLSRLNESYERFVPSEFLQFLSKESILEVELGDQIQQEMTILFSDIRDFTSLSEQMTPSENFRFINSYLRRVSPIIRQHHGFVDKYLGDGIMALFPQSSSDALQTAIAMQSEVARYNIERQRAQYRPIKIGIGVHSGRLMLGTIGEQQRMQSTVISAAVNLAARLQEYSKRYGAAIVASQQALGILPKPDMFNCRLIDKVQGKNKENPIAIYEVFDSDEQNSLKLKLETRATFEEGVKLFHEQEHAKAQASFKSVLDRNPNDLATLFYLQRIAQSMVDKQRSDQA